jgi:hypothetical protein
VAHQAPASLELTSWCVPSILKHILAANGRLLRWISSMWRCHTFVNPP